MLSRADSKKSINPTAWFANPDFKEESEKWHADHLDKRRDLNDVEVAARLKSRCQSRSRRSSIINFAKDTLFGGVNKLLSEESELEPATPRQKAPDITVCVFPV